MSDLPRPAARRRAESALLAALAAVAAFVFLVDLGGGGLTHRDERVYAKIGVTMLETGDFLTPRYLGDPFFNKPPLAYWAVAASTAAFGESRFAARLPSALAAIAGILLVARFAAVRISLAAGAVAGLAALANWLYFSNGRLSMMDAPLAVLVFLALTLILRGRRVAAWGVMGAAVLLKGFLGVVLPLGAVAAGLALARRPREALRLASVPAVAVFLLVAAPWYVAMAAVHGRAFVDFFFGTEHLFAYMGEAGRRTYDAWPYPFFAIFSFGAFAPAVVIGAWATARSARGDVARCACFVLGAGTIVGFALAFRKADRYFLPAVLPLAVLAADFLVHGTARAARFALGAGASVLALAALGAPLAVAWATAGEASSARLLLAALPFAAGAAAAVSFLRGGRRDAAAASLGAGSVAGLAAAVAFFLGDLAHDPGPRFTAAIEAAGLSAAPFAAETGQLETRLNLDFDRKVERLPDATALARWLEAADERGVAAVLRTTFDALPPDARDRAVVLAEDWQFARVSWRLLEAQGLAATWRGARVPIVLVERRARAGGATPR